MRVLLLIILVLGVRVSRDKTHKQLNNGLYSFKRKIGNLIDICQEKDGLHNHVHQNQIKTNRR